MINQNASEFLDCLVGFHFKEFVGVPDSVLANFTSLLDKNNLIKKHIIAANEGLALSLAAGLQLGNQNFPVVYLQNSGIGNLINPFFSMAHEKVFNFNILFVIGWRGMPGFKDEPQHEIQGKITIPQLKIMGLTYSVLSEELISSSQLQRKLFKIKKSKKSYVFLVPPKLFGNPPNIEGIKNKLEKRKVIETLLKFLPKDILLVSTTGTISRILNEQIQNNNYKHFFFPLVGAMGHAGSLALGLALNQSKKIVVILDGDGALLMHLGSITTIGHIKPRNIIHVIFDNGSHESVGGQDISNKEIEYGLLFKSVGYKRIIKIDAILDLNNFLHSLSLDKDVPIALIIKVSNIGEKNLSRPVGTPEFWKQQFLKGINN